MSGDASRDVARVRDDLAAMRESLGADPPYGRPVLLGWLGVAGVSGVAAVAAWTGSAMARRTAGVLGAVLIAPAMWSLARASMMRGTAPVAWREMRLVATGKLAGGPVLAAVLYWFWRTGLPLNFVLAAGALCAGVTTLCWGTTSPSRRSAFGIAGPLLGFASVLPVLPAARIPLAAAAAGVAAGLACTAILWIEGRMRTASVR